MSEAGSPGCDPARLRQVTIALWLVSVSIAFGMLSVVISVTTGLQEHSPGVLAVGLGVLADVAGSAALIWRFRAGRRQPGQSCPAEARAAIVIAIALAVVSVALTVQSAAALAAGSRPSTSGVTLGAAAVALPSSPRWRGPSGVSENGWTAALCAATVPSALSEWRPARWPWPP